MSISQRPSTAQCILPNGASQHQQPRAQAEVAAAEGGTKRETTKAGAKGTPTAAKMTKGDATQVGGEAAAALNNNKNNHGWMTATHAL